MWRIALYEHVNDLLRDPRVGMRLKDGGMPAMYSSGNDSDRPRRFMLLLDPPDHTRIRKLVSKAFTPRAVQAMRPRIQKIVDDLLATVDGQMDIIDDLAFPLPTFVICEMLGVPADDRDTFKVWTADATYALLPPVLSTPERQQRALEAGMHLVAYFTQLIAERRQHLGDDLMSGMIRAEEEGDRLTMEELLSNTIGLLIAGFETTMGLIGNGVRTLLKHGDQLELLRAQPQLIASAIEECLRFDSPIQATRRITHAPIDIGGYTIPEGEVVLALTGSANRDPARFSEPDRFLITRDDNPHLTFGFGPHVCLGAHLARMEAQVAIGTLVQRFPKLELASDEIEWGRSLFRVLAHLPVSLGARA
jgi:cytochrome P450